MDNIQLLAMAKEKTASGTALNKKETELYNNYVNTLKRYPNTYKNDPYGLLSELYDELQAFQPLQTDKENQISIYFKIVNTINDVILFAKTTELKPEKINEIIRLGKFLNQMKVSLTKVNEADINELKDAFKFDLDGNDTAQKFIENPKLIEAEILKGIEAAKPGEVANEKEIKPVPENAIHIFKKKETYNQFIEYTEKHIIEPYKDYSFLFQHLKHKKLIHNTKHLDFIKWLLSAKFITEKRYEEFNGKGGFRSLNKSSSNERENNFNNIFKLN